MAEPGDSLVFHITTARDWADAQLDGEYRLSTRGARLEDVGFIHASTADQFARIGARVFGDSSDPLVVLVIDTDRLEVPVVVEDLANEGEAFPHIYGPLPIDAVITVLAARITAGELIVDDHG